MHSLKRNSKVFKHSDNINTASVNLTAMIHKKRDSAIMANLMSNQLAVQNRAPMTSLPATKRYTISVLTAEENKIAQARNLLRNINRSESTNSGFKSFNTDNSRTPSGSTMRKISSK